jgi:hypothetical protein
MGKRIPREKRVLPAQLREAAMRSSGVLFGVAIIFVAAIGLLVLRDGPGILQVLVALLIFALAIGAGVSHSGQH